MKKRRLRIALARERRLTYELEQELVRWKRMFAVACAVAVRGDGLACRALMERVRREVGGC